MKTTAMATMIRLSRSVPAWNRKRKASFDQREATATTTTSACAAVAITSSHGEWTDRQAMPKANEMARKRPKIQARRFSSSQCWTKRGACVAVISTAAMPTATGAGCARFCPQPGQNCVPARTPRWQAGHCWVASGTTRVAQRERRLDTLEEECDDDQLDDPAGQDRSRVGDAVRDDEHEIGRGRDQHRGQRRAPRP